MATDATGTPTSPDSIPTYNTPVDAPSGKGFNAAMAAIQTALSARVGKPAGLVSGETAIWNGASFVRSSVTGLTPSGIAGYPANLTKALFGDGSWAGSARLLYDSTQAGVVFPTALITTPSLDQTFAHLLIVYEATTNTAGSNLMDLRINGDSGANYYGQRVTTTNAATTIATTSGGSAVPIGLAGGTTNTNYTGNGITLIANYSSALVAHPFTGLSSMFTGTGTTTFWNMYTAGMKGNTVGAVTSLSFLDNGGANILTGSRFSVYGLGGA